MVRTRGYQPAHLTIARDEFLEHCRVAKCLSPHTLRAYRLDLALFTSHIGADSDVTTVDRDAIRDYARVLLDVHRFKPATVRRRIATLRAFFRWLERENIVELSAFHGLDIPIRMPRRLPRALTSDEMRLLLRSCCLGKDAAYESLLMRFTIVMLFTTGVRVGELVAVQLSDVSDTDGMIHVRGKGARERRVFVGGPEAMALMRRYLRARRRMPPVSSQLLIWRRGDAITAPQVRRRLGRLARQCGIRRHVTPHMLRHTAATQLLEAGVDIRFVQRLLGHTSIATTQLYAEVRDEALRARLARANTFGRLARAG